jgi:hypothetical protein
MVFGKSLNKPIALKMFLVAYTITIKTLPYP